MTAKDSSIVHELVTVSYNFSERIYEVSNGAVLETFPAGKENKLTAELAALAYNAPDLHSLVLRVAEKHPELKSRAVAAANMLLADGLLPPDPYDHPSTIARIQSVSDDDERYLVQWRDGYVCSCPDHQFGKAPNIPFSDGWERPICKHSLLVSLAKRSGRAFVEAV